MKNEISVGMVCLALGITIGFFSKIAIVSDQPIKLSYTLKCEDDKCDTTYKASTR
jgi:hypothetical protein